MLMRFQPISRNKMKLTIKRPLSILHRMVSIHPFETEGMSKSQRQLMYNSYHPSSVLLIQQQIQRVMPKMSAHDRQKKKNTTIFKNK